MQLYPLRLHHVAREKIWGASAASWARMIRTSSRGRIGELWLAWEGSLIANGALAGKPLGDLLIDHGSALLGPRVSGSFPGAFPLIVKVIQTAQDLSVQVHPDDEAARELEQDRFGKCEAWFVADAEPGARLIHGVRRTVARSAVRAALAQRTLVALLRRVAVRKGDVIVNPAGTIHAIGAGMRVFEVQQASDRTYRLYDWDRRAGDGRTRDLHVDKGVSVASLKPLRRHKTRPLTVEEPGARRRLLYVCPHFGVELLEVNTGVSDRTRHRSFHVLAGVEGRALVRTARPSAYVTDLETGEAVIVPAALDRYEIVARGPRAVVLKCYVPDLQPTPHWCGRRRLRRRDLAQVWGHDDASAS